MHLQGGIHDGTGARFMLHGGSVGGGVMVDTQTFLGVPGMWLRPEGMFMRCKIGMAGAGGGGASGRKSPNNLARCGGGGGSHGAIIVVEFDFADMPDALSVSCGAGGLGGAPQTTDLTNGNPGMRGDDSTIQGLGFNLIATGGNGGNGGTSTAGTGGSGLAVGLSMFSNMAGAAAGSNGAAGLGATSGVNASGAGGGGCLATLNFNSGGPGKASILMGGGFVSQGSQEGQNGEDAPTDMKMLSIPPFGCSGGGGAGGITVNGGNAGASSGYGAGGSGGGAGTQGFASGAGANGAPGAVIIVCY